MSAFDTTKRKPLSNQKRAAVFEREHRTCYICTRVLPIGERYQIEHPRALVNGGPDDISELKVVCLWCHPEKTKNDHKIAAKARRVATKHVIPNSQRQKRGRPMAGTRQSGWKHKCSGEWERR